MQRKLATIMVGDIVGSTPRMEADEERAVQDFEARLGNVSEAVAKHSGRVFNRAGDAVLAEFQSPINALRAAMDARGGLASQAGDPGPPMRFGLHLADVVELDGDLRGDGVNLAARIQSAADPGAIDASEALFTQVRRNSPCIFDDLGPRSFKGITEQIRVFRVRDRLDGARRGSASPADVAPTGKPRKRPHSIAVMPFSTASSSSEDQHFLAEGIAEDLALELGRHSQLFVVSYTASLGLAGQSPTEAGEALGVRYVLSGSVRTLGDRIRLNLTLTETDGGRVVWTKRLQDRFDGFVDMMDEITAQVGTTVLGRVLDTDMQAARGRQPETLDAYEAYLRGLDYHRRGGVTDQNIRTAMTWFDRATERDPNFARAQAMWVCSASWLQDYDWDSGRARIQRALELDPHDAETNRIMGAILMKEHKYEEARAYHEIAMRAAPNDAYIAGRTAAFYTFVGEPARALEMLDKAEQLDPLLPAWITEERIAALYALGRMDDMLAEIGKLSLQTRRSRLYKAAGEVAVGNLDAAQQTMRQLCTESPSVTYEWVRYNEVFRDRDILKTLIDQLTQAGLSK